MKDYRTYPILLYTLLFTAVVSLKSSGQETGISIEDNFQNSSFTDLVNHIEKTTGYRFFFDPSWTDTLTVVQPPGIQSLEKILFETLTPANIYFVIDKNEHIILSGSYPVKAGLPEDFFIIPDSKQGAQIAKQEIHFPEQISKPLKDQSNELIIIGNMAMRDQKGKVNLSGFIREHETGEPLTGAIVYVEELGIGAVSDINGYYILLLPRGQYQITFQNLGKEKINVSIQLNSGGRFDIDLKDKLTELKAVEITADRKSNVSGIQTGVERLEINTIKSIPAMLGETDLVKAALFLPGIKTVGEISSGFNVRGGSTDQNLILFNNAPVFNPSHLFGFFSAFNPDVIKEFEIYKSGIPAQYGGRVSSVFDIKTKQGNMKKISVNAGISPVAARVSVEGPIIKDKLSFLLGTRATYSDWILKRIQDPAIQNSDARFYDITGKTTWKISTKNLLDISGYYSNDNFKLNSDTVYQYNNHNISASWKHFFSEKLIAEFQGLLSGYTYNISSRQNSLSDFILRYNILHNEFRSDFHLFLNNKHTFQFGFSSIFYIMNPNEFRPLGSTSDIVPFILEKEHALESGFYFSDEYDAGPQLKLYAGIRYSMYQYLGPRTVYLYGPDAPREKTNITDTLKYGPGELMQSYSNPELRLAIRYKFNERNSIKMSYNRITQYLQMLSNTMIMSPTDTWKLSDNNIKPQYGDQVALGFYKDLPYNIETSVETYYKRIENILEYKGGARLINNEQIETDLINGRGKAYGVELILRKNAGRLNGWISYTWSRTFAKVDSKYDFEDINNGEYFPSNFDMPHNISGVFNYIISRRLNFSSNIIYNTGRPITYPVAKFPFNNGMRLYYSERNAYRIPDYFRWDFSVNLEGNLRSDKIAHSSWSFAVYNLTGRNNVYSIYFITKRREIKGYKMSIFAIPVFTVTYNIKF
jgi:hypothetical protein